VFDNLLQDLKVLKMLEGIIICPECGLTYWKCSKCGFLITAAMPPEKCPQCKEKCDFLDVTCYTPDCGGPGNIDPRL